MTEPKRGRKNPLTSGLPDTIPIAESMANLERNSKRRNGKRPNMDAFTAADPAEPFPTPKTLARMNEEGLKAIFVNQSTPSTLDLREELPNTPVLIRCTDIACYDHNPRLFTNESEDEIRQSLLKSGFRGALTVTRRRKGDPYMLAAGSNTTLRLLQQLYEQTGDSKFLNINCIIQPFESETRLLSQHLGENLNRGDMRFWEVAQGMVALLDQLEAERRERDPQQGEFSSREAVEALEACGLKANRASMQFWRFASQRLSSLGSALPHLGFNDVKEALQPRLSAIETLCNRFGIKGDAYWGAIVSPTLAQVGKIVGSGEPFDAGKACEAVEAAAADAVKEDPASFRQMLAVLKLNPYASLSDLRVPSPSLVVGANPAADERARQAASAPVASQSPLSLTPGVVRDSSRAGAAPASARAGSAQADTGTAAASDEDSLAGASRGAVGSSLFDAPADESPADSWEALRQALVDAAHAAQLDDCLVFFDAMPLGFYMELPDRKVHQRVMVPLLSDPFFMREVKTHVWWQLALLAGQMCNAAVDVLDHESRFLQHYRVEQRTDPFEDLEFERGQRDGAHLALDRIKPRITHRAPMRALRLVEERISQMLTDHPDRWEQLREFWRSEDMVL